MLDGTLFQELGKGFSPLRLLPNDDAAVVKVVVEGFAFAEEFGGEDEVQVLDRRVGSLIAMTDN